MLTCTKAGRWRKLDKVAAWLGWAELQHLSQRRLVEGQRHFLKVKKRVRGLRYHYTMKPKAVHTITYMRLPTYMRYRVSIGPNMRSEFAMNRESGDRSTYMWVLYQKDLIDSYVEINYLLVLHSYRTLSILE